MYNNRLVELYKVAGNYVLDVMNRKSPLKKRRGRRRKETEDETLLLEDDTIVDTADDDLGDEE